MASVFASGDCVEHDIWVIAVGSDFGAETGGTRNFTPIVSGNRTRSDRITFSFRERKMTGLC